MNALLETVGFCEVKFHTCIAAIKGKDLVWGAATRPVASEAGWHG